MGFRKILVQVTWVGVIIAEMASAAVAAPLANRDCPKMCGNLEIPYPFGTTKDCYLDKFFFINCKLNSSTGLSEPWFGDVIVKNISYHGQLDILMFTANACYNETGLESRNQPYLRVGANYTISSTQNQFVAIGCDTYAFLRAYRNDEQFSIGCTSICESISNVISGSCSGIGCCEVVIPPGLKNFTLLPRSYNNHTNVLSFNPCTSAFVVKKDHFKFSSDYLYGLQKNETVPMVLDWAIGNDTCEYAQTKSDYVCGGNSTCVDLDERKGYRCSCKSGYDGNPYLEDGCQDIDECETQNPCSDPNQICTNVAGGHNCSCPDGYEEHQLTNGTVGCRAKVNQSKIISVALGICISFLALMAVGSWIYWERRRRELIKLKAKFFVQNGGLRLLQQLSTDKGSMEIVKIFRAEELEKATENYDESRVLGRGGYGTVYRGVLSDNKVVAIKKSKLNDSSQIEQFINEVIVLAQINHRNVVKLLGCCLETEVPLLVYEFITNGTLSEHIHDESKSCLLSWEKRLRIASETAGAIAYLHSEASIPIIHRDVKTTNILLDDNYTAKVADFGASRLVPLDQTQLTTLVQGTLGYLDPEYFHTSQLTEKSDVYSFGVVVAELLTGKEALSFHGLESQRSLAMYFVAAVKENRLLEILEDGIKKEINIEELKEVAELAKRCLRVKREDRPTMKEVAMELEGLRTMGKHPWGKADDLEIEETEHLLSAPAAYSVIINVGNDGSSSSTAVGYESMRNQVLIKPLDIDGR